MCEEKIDHIKSIAFPMEKLMEYSRLLAIPMGKNSYC